MGVSRAMSKPEQDKYITEHRQHYVDANIQIISELAGYDLSFNEFCLIAKIWFDQRFSQWTVSVADLHHFHYFSAWRESSGAWDEADVLRQAFDKFRLILAHQGQVNMSHVFIDSECVDIYRTKQVQIMASVSYSPILGRWFTGYDFTNKQGGYSGSSCAPSLSDRSSFQSKENAVESVKERAIKWMPLIATLMPTQTRQPSLFS